MAVRPKAMALPLLPMRTHPLRPSTIAWAVGRCLFVYDTASSTWEQHRREVHSDTVRALDAMATSESQKDAGGTTRWVSSGDDKQITIWQEGGGAWETLETLSHAKKVVAAIFDGDARILIADRFGDVYRWQWEKGASSDEPQLLFSHLAIVTAMVMTESGRFLVTGDNHEKIRVSCYPQAAEIYSFCLGHLGQITALGTLGEQAVVSGSTDGTLRVWSLDGEPTACCELGAAVSSLCCVSSAAVVVGCEASPGLRRVRFGRPEAGGAPEPEVLALASEAPQAICALPGGDAVAWVDRAGHLRTPPQPGGANGEWGSVFEGEDLPASLVGLSKCADPNYAEEAGAGDEDAVAQPRKRRPK
mmetsp:Transcript_98633/g.306956  ORF Transcript_98633/g.306956 Transcript_98633/m.306956 type:complete len:360 (-) Transcript_98633:75-1154(-)